MAKENAKKKNTSKTARVLGLLTSPPPTEEPLEPAAPQARSKPDSAAQAASKPESAVPKPSSDEVVETQIRDALASGLDEPLPPEGGPAPAAGSAPADKPEPAAEPEPAVQPGSVPAPAEEPAVLPPLEENPAPVPEDEPVLQPPLLLEEPAPALMDKPVIQPSLAQEEPAPVPDGGPAAWQPPVIQSQPEPEKRPKPVVFQAHPDHIQDTDEGFTCFNVMQALVEAKTDKYIKLFGLCTCARCRTDVVALALTNLPAKYVVTSSREMVPLLSVYEGQYSTAVISQVMNACKKVMEHPRHSY